MGYHRLQIHWNSEFFDDASVNWNRNFGRTWNMSSLGSERINQFGNFYHFTSLIFSPVFFFFFFFFVGYCLR